MIDPAPFEQSPLDERGKFELAWHMWINDVQAKINDPVLPSYTDTTRPDPDVAGTQIWNTDDGQMNIADGTNWTLPDGSIT